MSRVTDSITEEAGPVFLQRLDSVWGAVRALVLSTPHPMRGQLSRLWPPYLECVPLVEGQLVALCGLEAVQGHGLHAAVPEPRQLGSEQGQQLPASSAVEDRLPLF